MINKSTPQFVDFDTINATELIGTTIVGVYHLDGSEDVYADVYLIVKYPGMFGEQAVLRVKNNKRGEIY